MNSQEVESSQPTPLKDVFVETVTEALCSLSIAILSGILLYKALKRQSSRFILALIGLMLIANLSGFANSVLTYLNAEDDYKTKSRLITQQVFFYFEMLSANLLYWTYAANYWSLSMRLRIVTENG